MSEEDRDILKAMYLSEENNELMQNSALTEWNGYCVKSRVEELIEFAGRMNYKKIGIACCIALKNEASILAKVLKANGFQTHTVVCKVGAIPKTELGIDEKCKSVGPHACNPIYQAEELNRAGTDLNVVVGLCVGHDILFHKYIEGPTTTLVVKDRVTGHNPAVALYLHEGVYKKKLYPQG